MSQSNIEIVQAMFDAMAAGDFELMKSYLHPEVIVNEAECLPYSGIYQGPDAYIALVHKVVGTWDDLQLSVDAMAESGRPGHRGVGICRQKQSGRCLQNADDGGVPFHGWKNQRGEAVLFRYE